MSAVVLLVMVEPIVAFTLGGFLLGVSSSPFCSDYLVRHSSTAGTAWRVQSFWRPCIASFGNL
jgi:hypothetical protein